MISLENSTVGRTLDPLQALYPNLEVVHIGLETPWTKKVNGVYPFALGIDYDIDGAVILSYQGINPLTGTPAIPKMAYEVIENQGEIESLIPNWITLKGIPLKEKQGKILSFGCSVNPESKGDLVRQSILTTDRSLAIAAEKPPREQKINTLSLLFFRRKYAWLNGEQPTLPSCLEPDSLTCAVDENCQYFIANAGRLKIQPLVCKKEDRSQSQYFHDQPAFLVRFHFLTQESAEKIQRDIETRNYFKNR